MNKLILMLLTAAMVTTMAQADVKNGQKTYIKTFIGAFGGLKGEGFTGQHTSSEWEDLFENDGAGFIKEYSEKYPKAAPILNNPDNKSKLKELSDFAIKYSSDSGNIPSCGD